MPLSDVAVRKAKPAEKPYKMADFDGLYVVVAPSGSRLWRMDYQFKGKRKTLSFGRYPEVSLSQARENRDAARTKLRQGLDPSAEKKRDAPKGVVLFGAVAEKYLDRLARESAPTTMKKNRWLMRLAADLDDMPVASITPADVLAILRKVEASGRYETARRLRSTLSSVFRMAVVSLEASADPAALLVGATKSPIVQSRSAVTDERELGALMISIDEYDGWPTLRSAMLFQALTACRPGEVRGAEWREIDRVKALWSIPAARMKMRSDHLVPLSRQALAALDDIARLTAGGRLVFPSIRNHERPLSENAMNSALRRMGYMKDEHTAHGFRSSFSTIMNQRQFDPELIEQALAHTDGSVRAIYNRSRNLDRRAELMQSWADLLDGFRVK